MTAEDFDRDVENVGRLPGKSEVQGSTELLLGTVFLIGNYRENKNFYAGFFPVSIKRYSVAREMLSVLQISSTVLSSNYLPNHLEIAYLTTHRFSSIFPFEEKGSLKMGLVKNALFIFTLRNASYGPGSPIHLASGQFRNHKSVKQL
jgi:hypothetical protein